MSVDNLIIDGTNLEFRIFCITRGYKTTDESGTSVFNPDDPTGELSNSTYKFLQTFISLTEKFNPTNVYASWDKKLQHPSTNFRKDILVDQYKAGRVKPSDIQDMYDQEVILIEMLESLGVKNIFPNVLEADDVCAWLSTILPGKTIIVSVDQDLLQLITPNISVYNLKELITYSNFESKKGIKPELYKLFKAIKGDSSDNINGLNGYGEVRSRKLAANWDTTNVTEEVKQIVERNLKLMDLHFGFNFQEGEKQKYEEQLNYVKNVKGDIERFKNLCAKNGFVTIIENMGKWKHFIRRNDLSDFISKLS
jgi:DNA polymerase-1